tara:strand:- start:321 stop:2741 length:2421 start_codon:yes stop_codon:yes gene_type:complete
MAKSRALRSPYVPQHERLSELLRILAYSDDDKLFLSDDKNMVFAFECTPLPGLDDKVMSRLNVLLNNEWPDNAVLQVCLFGSPNVRDSLIAMKAIRLGNTDPLLNGFVNNRAKFLDDGTSHPVERATHGKIRDWRLYVSVTAPIADPQPTAKEIESISTLRRTVQQSLETALLNPKPMSDRDYLRVMSTVLNWGDTASWRNKDDYVPEPDRPLSHQVFDYDKAMTVDDKGLWLGDKRVKVFSVKDFPDQTFFGSASTYVGDMLTGSRGVKDPFILTVSISFPPLQKTKGKLEAKRQWVTSQAYGPMLKFVPKLAHKKNGFDVLFQALDAGDKPIRTYMSMAIFSDSEEEAVSASSNVRSYFGELQFNLLEDRYFCMPLFLNLLPMGADRGAMDDLFRYKTMATRHVIPLLPIFGEWKGTGTPTMQYVARNGQLQNVCLFDSKNNYNATVAAVSGAGKSYLVNFLASSYLSKGAQIWIIDIGKSYKKLLEVYEGDFVEFGENSKICLNPFDIVEDYDEEADMLVGLIKAMAAPNDGLTDYQYQGLKTVLKTVWDELGSSMTIDDLAKALKKEGDLRLQDIGVQLGPYTANGQYGAYFNGKNNARFDGRLTCLELEELSGRTDLQTVVLLQLIYQIQQAMYHGEPDRDKIVIIDEAWSLFEHGDVSKFIEHGYRRFRKYRGAAITITQSVMDLYKSPTTEAIANNSANMYLLMQKPEVVERMRREEKLPLVDGEYTLLKSVQTVPPSFSEIMFTTAYGNGVGRLIVDPAQNLLFSTNPKDKNDLLQKQKQGMDINEAITAVLKDRGMI